MKRKAGADPESDTKRLKSESSGASQAAAVAAEVGPEEFKVFVMETMMETKGGIATARMMTRASTLLGRMKASLHAKDRPTALRCLDHVPATFMANRSTTKGGGGLSLGGGGGGGGRSCCFCGTRRMVNSVTLYAPHPGAKSETVKYAVLGVYEMNKKYHLVINAMILIHRIVEVVKEGVDRAPAANESTMDDLRGRYNSAYAIVSMWCATAPPIYD